MTGLAVVEGPEAQSRLGSALVMVRDVLSYLKADVGPVDQSDLVGLAVDGWFDCQAVVEDPAALERAIRRSADLLGTEDQVVAASLWVQGYAYRVLTVAVACTCIVGVIPDSSPARMAMGSSRGRPSLVIYTDPAIAAIEGSSADPGKALAGTEAGDLALGFLIDTAVDSHLRALVSTVHSVVKVGERLLWGNVAASAAMAFRTLEGCLGSWVIPLGERFFEIAPGELHGLGSFLVLEDRGHHGWFWERTNCCLYDRLPGKTRCGDCSRTPDAQRRAAYEKTLREKAG